MSGDPVTLAIPSKGRLMERTREVFAAGGLAISKVGHERGYRGRIEGVEDVDVAFLSASEIASQLRRGRVHLGVTGEDLIRETIADAEARVEFVRPLGFGRADVVVAVPECWIDVSRMDDLEDVAAIFQRRHGHRLRVATKYLNLTRRFFAQKGVMGYRIVESLGATEGTPADGSADIVVDITSTGTTLKANHLKVLDDGVILKSEANLLASRIAEPNDALDRVKAAIAERLEAVG
ncbi:MAG: ATP phosphoribosyltransferase [Hyphomicrobiales bacterium]|nr:ATP phosphoribosyltransferase [Hyphomicrobiales bacterium]